MGARLTLGLLCKTLLGGGAWIAMDRPDAPASSALAPAEVRPGAQLASPAAGSLEAGEQLPSSRAALVLSADATAEVEIRDATSAPLGSMFPRGARASCAWKGGLAGL